MEQEFTVLENKIVGRNTYLTRKIKDKKAAEVADYLGISESAYSKYERGESKITVEIIQKVAELLKVDPLSLLSSSGGNIVDSGISNSPTSIVGNNNINAMNEEQTKLITKLIETQIAMTEKIMALLEKK